MFQTKVVDKIKTSKFNIHGSVHRSMNQ